MFHSTDEIQANTASIMGENKGDDMYCTELWRKVYLIRCCSVVGSRMRVKHILYLLISFKTTLHKADHTLSIVERDILNMAANTDYPQCQQFNGLHTVNIPIRLLK